MKRSTLLTVVALLLALAGMTTLTSYSVTLYRLFCQATGANGTTQRVATGSSTQVAREVTILFDTNTAPGLPWRFTPLQRQVRVRLGQNALVFFKAENLSDRAITGRATFNVTPEKIGLYFKKVQCFCFSQETLNPGAIAEMPVDFYVDPALAQDPGAEDVHEITLSYTFFESKAMAPDALNLARFAAAPGNPADGAKLFGQDCAECHALEKTKIGPALAGVVGRRAGSLPGYPYSAGLKKAGFQWTTAKLDQWLADPQRMIPGAAMPVHLPEEQARRDIIAYLQGAQPGS